MDKEFLNNLLWTLFGAFIAVIMTRVFDRPIDRFQRRTNYWWHGVKERLGISKNLAAEQDEFQVGKLRVKWVVCQGSAEFPYTHRNIRCIYDPTPLELPSDRQQKKARIDEEQKRLKDAGKPHFHPGPTVALDQIIQSQIGDLEEPVLTLRVRPSDYYTLLATAMSLDEQIETEYGGKITVRDRYLRNLHYERPIPEFASALSINLALVSNDGYILVSKRSSDVGSDPNFMAPAINECVNPVRDQDANGIISIFATAKRGAKHELNIEIKEDELEFFTVGVDTRYYFYQLTGLIRSRSFSRDDIRARYSQSSTERWEAEKYQFIKFNPAEVAKFLSKSSERWTPYGIVCLIQALISEFGISEVERALATHPPKIANE